jgi:acyl-CoA synthetase (AMP-forming)/AMP-acid ligase II
MFHCNGWCFPWTVAARAGVNVCLRKFDPKLVFDLIAEHGITHYCAAPIVHAALANAPRAGAPASAVRSRRWWPARRRQRPCWPRWRRCSSS